MRTLLALVVIMFSLIPLIIPMFHLFVEYPLLSLCITLTRIENPMIVDAFTYLGYEDNMFNMHGENVHNFVKVLSWC